MTEATTLGAWRRCAAARLSAGMSPAASALGIDIDHQLDADLLLMRVLERSRSFLLAWPETRLDIADLAALETLLKRRLNGEPTAYLIGHREFHSLEFEVDARVLVPREDTEILLELALDRLEDHVDFRVLDAGTGAGIIATVLALESRAEVLASDNDAEALQLARSNAERHAPGRVHLFIADWLEAMQEDSLDLVVSNPPYIARHEAELALLRGEPPNALISGEDGLDAIRTLIDQARRCLRPGGRLLIEHGHRQGQAVRDLFEAGRYCEIETHPDLVGRPRVTLATVAKSTHTDT